MFQMNEFKSIYFVEFLSFLVTIKFTMFSLVWLQRVWTVYILRLLFSFSFTRYGVALMYERMAHNGDCIRFRRHFNWLVCVFGCEDKHESERENEGNGMYEHNTLRHRCVK